MVGIQGVGWIPEPKPERPAKVRDDKPKDVVQGAPAKDDLVISSEAQAAAKLAASIRAIADQPDTRVDRVATAKERLDNGEYKKPEVVAKVAERISRYRP
jgi:anti-sigma28 factor (negative regulator of flagellin synthesis)